MVLANKLYIPFAIDPISSQTLYVGTEENGVFLKVRMGVKSWNAINEGLPEESINVIAITPNAPATLYAGTSDGLYKSTNAGENWNAKNNGDEQIPVFRFRSGSR